MSVRVQVSASLHWSGHLHLMLGSHEATHVRSGKLQPETCRNKIGNFCRSIALKETVGIASNIVPS